MTFVITEACIDTKNRCCTDECPVDCIYEGDRMLYIHPDECVDCGACVAACPVDAIFYEGDLPGELRGFRLANAAFFDGVGSPGGAATMGPLAGDADLVASYR
jgi:NAD-dependent dihydropyrimidine dehydrogenase PreA subunit